MGRPIAIDSPPSPGSGWKLKSWNVCWKAVKWYCIWTSELRTPPLIRTLLPTTVQCVHAWHVFVAPQALTLNENKLEILSYVESRMSFIAPNMSKVVGPTVAAKLIGKHLALAVRSLFQFFFLCSNYRSCWWPQCIVKNAFLQHPGEC